MISARLSGLFFANIRALEDIINPFAAENEDERWADTPDSLTSSFNEIKSNRTAYMQDLLHSKLLTSPQRDFDYLQPW